jgi:methionyl aminopeptidase
MAVTIKTPEEIEKMRNAGRLAAEVLEVVAPHVRAGVSTEELDRICHRHIVEVQGAIPAPLNYHGFPRSICTSVNHQVCHGIPGDRVLRNGDIVNVDVTVIKDGYHGDTSQMFLIGEVSLQARRVSQVSRECLLIGLSQVRAGAPLRAIGQAIQRHAESNGCSVVREYCGHGIGRQFHEEPQVLHYDDPKSSLVLEPGMTFTIEPMVNAGRRHVKLLRDGWTVVTKDHSLSAQWEHTVLVTEAGYEVLTRRRDEAL